MTITLRTSGDAYVCESGFTEKDVPKAAGFTWDKIVAKKWATKDPDKARKLLKYADQYTRDKLNAATQAAQDAKRMSRASNIDVDLSVPDGLDYLPYQKVGIVWGLNRQGTLLADEMGLGKTIQLIGLINNDPTIERVLIVCPASLKLNWKRELEKWLTRDLTVGIVTPDAIPDADILIVNYDILHRFDFNDYQWDVVAADEVHYCFPYDTMVLTIEGWRKIGDIVHCNETAIVASFNSSRNVLEYKPVVARYKTPAPPYMVRVTHETGEFVCTPDHEVWVEESKSYVKAVSLHSGASLRVVQTGVHNPEKREEHSTLLREQLRRSMESDTAQLQREVEQGKPEAIDYESLRLVRERVLFSQQGRDKQQQAAILSEQLRSILASGLTSSTGAYQKNTKGSSRQKQGQPATRFDQAHEREQSNEQSSNSGESAQCHEGPLFLGEGWQWASYNPPTDTPRHVGVAARMVGVSDTNSASEGKVPQPAGLLQGGYCTPGKQDGYRGGRTHTHQQEVEVPGQAQDGSFIFSRVVSITLLEQRSNGQPADCSTEDYVYDIQVEDNHNFFVQGGVLVSNCKNPKARRSKALHDITNTKRRVAMTGTPICNKPAELFPIIHWVDPVTWPKFWPYAQRYCNARQGQYGWELDGSSNLAELQDKLRSTCMIRRLKADVLTELPPKRRAVVVIPNENGSKAIVQQEMAAYEHHQAGLQEAMAARDLAKAAGDKEQYAIAVERLRALNGVMLADMSRIRHESAIAKAPHVVSHVENILEDNDGYKVIVFAHHKAVVDLLVQKLDKYHPVKVTGDVGMVARQAAVDAFQNDPSCQVFIGNIQAAGVGLTLTASAHVVFAELDWVPGNVTQAEDRAHRIGQRSSVLIEHLVFDGSLDAKMAKTIIAKQRVIEQALDTEETEAEEVALADEDVPVKRKEQADIQLSEAQQRAVHEALRILAGDDTDMATQRNDVGFNRYDVKVGHSLADAYELTPAQAKLGYKVVRKYRKQLPLRIKELLGL